MPKSKPKFEPFEDTANLDEMKGKDSIFDIDYELHLHRIYI